VAKEMINLCFGFLIESMMFLISSLDRTIGGFLLRLPNFKIFEEDLGGWVGTRFMQIYLFGDF